jgi:transcription antitermination protein NusB
MLFQWDLGRHTPDQVTSTFLGAQKLDPEVERFARGLFEGAVSEIAALDALVRQQSQHWRVERMPAVDRNVLRVALVEMLHHPETPAAVVINEAMEIARRFSGEEAVEFVNGVLDGIRKTLPARDAEPAQPREARAQSSGRKRRASRSKDGYGK